MLLIDNYDSFAYNLARYLMRLGQNVVVVRNDNLDIEEILRRPPSAVVISPGPCAPQNAGKCLNLIRQLPGAIPLLGICLGHQIIAEAAGGAVIRAQRPIHGTASVICHDGQGEFTGLDSPFLAGRYHSLVVNEAMLPTDFVISARSEEGEIMAIRHREWPRFGWQFHPESILTPVGYALLAGFLHLARLPVLAIPTAETPSEDLLDEIEKHPANPHPLTF